MQKDLWDEEEWRDIPGYDGDYQASSLGRIRSRYSGEWKIRKQKIDDGYYRIVLCKNGEAKTYAVNRIVCRVFNGEPPKDKPLALHKNDIKRDNRSCNLYWGSQDDNVMDCHKNNRYNPPSVCGERAGGSKLSRKDVLEIRYIYKNTNKTQKELAKKYNVTVKAIGSITSGKSWKHISQDNCIKKDKGLRRPESKFSKNDILNIRNMYSRGKTTYKDISKDFNVWPETIGKIIRGETYTHVK